MLREGVAKLFAPDFVEGPFPEHYEPAESPVENALHPKSQWQPAGEDLPQRPGSTGTSKDYPYVALTYRLTEHFHYWTKHIKRVRALQPISLLKYRKNWLVRKASRVAIACVSVRRVAM